MGDERVVYYNREFVVKKKIYTGMGATRRLHIASYERVMEPMDHYIVFNLLGKLLQHRFTSLYSRGPFLTHSLVLSSRLFLSVHSYILIYALETQ